MVEAPGDWPEWRVFVEVLDSEELAQRRPDIDCVTDRGAKCKVPGTGWMTADRTASRSTLYLEERPDAARLLHPFFSLSASLAALWSRDVAVHASALVGPTGAWGLLGSKGSGKSSTVAAWADRGGQILTDDVLVIRDGIGLAGPRLIDLRTDAAPRHNGAQPLGFVGARDRYRLELPAAPAAVPIAGWFLLEWGDTTELREVTSRARLEALYANLSVGIPPLDPMALPMLCSLPMYELVRPRTASALPEVMSLLERTVGAP